MFLYTFSKLFNCGIFSICLQILLHILYSSFPSPVPFFKITGFLSFSIYGKGFYHRIFHLPYHQHIEYYFLNCPRVKASSLSNSFSKKYFLLENFALPDFGFRISSENTSPTSIISFLVRNNIYRRTFHSILLGI